MIFITIIYINTTFVCYANDYSAFFFKKSGSWRKHPSEKGRRAFSPKILPARKFPSVWSQDPACSQVSFGLVARQSLDRKPSVCSAEVVRFTSDSPQLRASLTAHPASNTLTRKASLCSAKGEPNGSPRSSHEMHEKENRSG